MKKIILVITVLLSVALVTTQSCKKKDVEKIFTLNGGTILFHTNADSTFDHEWAMLDTTIQSDLQTTLTNNGIDINKVHSIKLKSAILRIAANSVAQGITFDPFTYANAHIKATGIDQKQLAFKTEIPDEHLTEFSFDSQDTELLDYLKQNNFEILVKAYNDVPIEATDYELTLTYDVKFNVHE